jgi:hypothetical protein
METIETSGQEFHRYDFRKFFMGAIKIVLKVLWQAPASSECFFSRLCEIVFSNLKIAGTIEEFKGIIFH